MVICVLPQMLPQKRKKTRARDNKSLRAALKPWLGQASVAWEEHFDETSQQEHSVK